MEKAIIFGASLTGQKLYEQLKEKYECICFVDNDSSKQGTLCKGLRVIPPEQIMKMDYDIIVIASLPGFFEIKTQLKGLGVQEKTIQDQYVKQSAEARIRFLKQYSKIAQDKNLDGAVAELGVYRGEFAKEINKVFPDKKMYMFDTFEGFETDDILYEKQMNLSSHSEGHFGNTSIELVMEKMQTPENCVIRKGYFPDSLDEQDFSETFCFVSIDCDLYLPAIKGLEFFYPRLEKGGLICIHDYFADTFLGIKKAVDEFCDNNNVSIMPVGDNISVSILK